MNKNNQKKPAEIKKRPGSPAGVSPRVIRRNSGGVVKQYPARIGYHGTGDETDLNPEE